MNLYVALLKAQVVEIDGDFIRNFNVDPYTQDADDVFFDAKLVSDENYSLCEWDFTEEECINAVRNNDNGWNIHKHGYDYNILAYTLNIIDK